MPTAATIVLGFVSVAATSSGVVIVEVVGRLTSIQHLLNRPTVIV